jgi:8-oxo-dGTP diphosphatase
VLAARRSRQTGFAGYWEFPGGKVEPGEEPRAALVREIVEELSATIVVGDEIGDVPWVISETLELRLFLASLTGGDPQQGADHDELRWLAPDDFDSVDWLPSDLLALETVRHAVCTPT